jgi:L-arabinokinase
VSVAVFYISGHGYGHAVRMVEVIRQLVAFTPAWTVHVCTTAPAHLFSELPDSALHIRPISIDAGVVEGSDSLSIDVAATVARIEPFLLGRSRLVEAEAEYIRAAKADVVVADIPHLAGDIGARATVPVLGISNFTWDFIYEPFLADHALGRAMLQLMREGYDRMRAVLRLPFHHEMHFDSQVIDVGLVAARSHRNAVDVLSHLGVAKDDTRKRVFVGGRGSTSGEGLREAANASPDYIFCCVSDVEADWPENTRRIHLGRNLSFSDVVAVSDVVVSKLGYGTLATCVATGTDLLYPPRAGFREDVILRRSAERYLRSRELPLEAFASGHWRRYLEDLRNRERPCVQLSVDGAGECARMIAATASTI